jgi:hypothetical protein
VYIGTPTDLNAVDSSIREDSGHRERAANWDRERVRIK